MKFFGEVGIDQRPTLRFNDSSPTLPQFFTSKWIFIEIAMGFLLFARSHQYNTKAVKQSTVKVCALYRVLSHYYYRYHYITCVSVSGKYNHHLFQLFSNSRSHHNTSDNCASKQQHCICNSRCTGALTSGANTAAQAASSTAKTACRLHHRNKQHLNKQSWDYVTATLLLYISSLLHYGLSGTYKEVSIYTMSIQGCYSCTHG